MKRITHLIVAVFLFTAIGCVTGCVTGPPPIEEWLMAKTAMDAAKAVDAQKHSPGNWHQAEEAYRRAQILFRDREHPDAKEMFIRARLAAERAENAARLIRQKSGEVL